MNNYRLTAGILSFILAVSALPVSAAAGEISPRAASDIVETLLIEEPEDSGESQDTYEFVETVETAGSDSEETVEAAESAPGETVETEGSESGNNTGSGEDADAAAPTHEVKLPSGQEGIRIRSAGSTTVTSKESFTFYLSPAEGWQKTKNFSVKAGETVLKPVPVKKAESEKHDSENTGSENGTPASENGESASGTGGDSAEDADDSSAQDSSSMSRDSLEKSLISQGYEKYVIAEVTGDITVSVTGVEKIPASETKESEEDKETGSAEDHQEPAPDAPDIYTQDPPEGDPAEVYADGDFPQEDLSRGQDTRDQDFVNDSDSEQAYMTASGDLPGSGDQVSSDENGFSDEGEAVVPGADENLVPGIDESGHSDTEESIIPGEENIPYGEEAAAAGETDEESGSDSAPGEAAGDSAGGQEDDTIDGSPSDTGSTAESGDSGEQTSEPAQSGGTADQSKTAKSEVEYPLWVEGIRATDANSKDITGDGTISYDHTNNILTLKNAAVKGRKEAVAPIYYSGDKALTITFSGDCSITDPKAGSGIVCENSSLILNGTGSLTVKTAAPLNGACIKADKGELTISGGTVTAVSSDIGPGLSASRITIGNDAVRVEAGSSEKAVSAGSEIAIGSLLWITTPSGGKISDDKKTITTDSGKTAAQAVIEPKPVYEVTFAPGEGSGTMDPKHVVMGGKLELPECSFTAPQCKAFSGWKVGDNIYKAGDSITVEKAFTATAQWKDSHSLEKIAKKDPTCLEKGNTEYYKCKVCGKCFSDSAASNPIKESDTQIPALGHKWGDPSYTWEKDYSAVTAKRICERDNTHVESEKVKTTKKGTDPTCEKEGKYTYTAVFSNKAFEKQTKNVRKPPLGHLWEKHEFIWTQNDDGSFDCECRFTCTRDSSHKKTVDADVDESVTLPTKSADGRLYCTATAELNGKEYTDKLEEPISPAGNSGYRFTRASDTWRHGSKKDLDFTVKRYDYDMITYRAFSHITVDGRTVNTSYYDTWEGSLKLEIEHRYLDLLDAGSHTLTVEFKDGSVSRSFTVKDAASKGSPSTGDHSGSLLWILSIVSCAAVITALLTLKLRKK